jgi:hypothetical protein
MTPLDDELRRTLSTRAATVAPAADPLEGIESRARGMRRRRTAVSLVGAVAAVAAVAIAVPSLTSDGGQELQLGTSPTPAASASATPQASQAPAQRPGNAVSWPVRSGAGADADGPDLADLRHRFAQAFDRTDADQVSFSPLFADRVDGVTFTTGQAWFAGGDNAYAVSYAVGPDNVPQFFVGPATAPEPWGLAFLIGGFGNTDHDLLVVVPRPGVGQVSYDDNASGAFRPAEMESALDGVALIPRDLQASKDRLEVLDGNGDLDNPMYRGPVTPLLCGLKECG